MNSRYKAAIAAVCLCIAMAGCGTSETASNENTNTDLTNHTLSVDDTAEQMVSIHLQDII